MSKLFIFDVDGTITKSKSPIDDDMANKLSTLVNNGNQIAFLSGGTCSQINGQIVDRLNVKDCYERVWLAGVSGAIIASYYKPSKYETRYENHLTDYEKTIIVACLQSTLLVYGHTLDINPEWGEIIEDRKAQITYSAMGQKATIKAKEEFSKIDNELGIRNVIINHLKLIPSMQQFECRRGGLTSIDITRKNLDKKTGMFKLLEILGRKRSDCIYFGDAFYPGGNDEPVLSTGVPCIAVKSIEETRLYIGDYI